jgi:hypothetical protein
MKKLLYFAAGAVCTYVLCERETLRYSLYRYLWGGAKSTPFVVNEEIIYSTYADASKVLDHLQHMIDTYGSVSINDYYDSIGLAGTTFLNERQGWTSLFGATIGDTSGGFKIYLPPTYPLKEIAKR